MRTTPKRCSKAKVVHSPAILTLAGFITCFFCFCHCFCFSLQSPVSASRWPGLAKSNAPLLETDPKHPVNNAFAHNPALPPSYDCVVRQFGVESASFVQPPHFPSGYFARLIAESLQMANCSDIIGEGAAEQTLVRQAESGLYDRRGHGYFGAVRKEGRTCAQSVFVEGNNGRDHFAGTLSLPVQTVQQALLLTRHMRLQQDKATTPSGLLYCINVRAGVYYFGANASSVVSSQIGALALTAEDSNTAIMAYNGEHVVFSGGVPLDLQWKPYRTKAAGMIMQAQLPTNIQLTEFNQLYVDSWRAIMAKWPNGNLLDHGLYKPGDTGYLPSSAAASWIEPEWIPSIDVKVQEPNLNGTYFQYHQYGLGGGASVFTPPRNFWSSKSPPAGDNYKVPKGVVMKLDDVSSRILNWTNVQEAFAHVFHAGQWGSWVWRIKSVVNQTVNFGPGGYQEARGNTQGGAFAFVHLLEELDDALEWYLHRSTRTLYFMPNATVGMPQLFVASQLPCILSLRGTSEQPIHDVLIDGIEFTQTSFTHMRQYEVPSSGDWSIHRGGSIFITGSEGINITHCNFTQLGSNGIIVSDYNGDALIAENEFAWLGDSAIILIGSSDGIDGVSNREQPVSTVVRGNLFRETGAFVKQSAPIFVGLTRNTTVFGNVAFNVPRSVVNFNDGFAGGHSVSFNVFASSVRETADHGAFNSWNRQPYLTDNLNGVPSLIQRLSTIHHNYIICTYNSFYSEDFDDGSAYWLSSENFLMYTGKKNYLGHSKTDLNSIFLYPDTRNSQGVGVCIADQAPVRGQSGWDEVWSNNTCIMYNSPIFYNLWNCDTENLYVPTLSNNRLYVKPGTQGVFQCQTQGKDVQLTLAQWQALGLDRGTTIEDAPDIGVIIGWARKLLQPQETQEVQKILTSG